MISSTPTADMVEFAWVIGAPLFRVILATGRSQASFLTSTPLRSVSGGLVILVCCSIRVEVAVHDVNKFVSVGKGEVSILEDIFPHSSLIQCDTSMVNTGGEFSCNVFVVLPELIPAMWVGPEDSITIAVPGSDPVTLGADPSPLPCGSTADRELLSFTKLDRIVVLGLDGLEIFNDSSEVDMAIAEDVAPEGIREWGTVALGVKTTDGILGVEVIDGLEHLSFSFSADIRSTPPRRSSPTHTPVPSIVRVVDVIVVLCPLRDTSRGIVIVILVPSQVRDVAPFLIGIPRHSRRVSSLIPSLSRRGFPVVTFFSTTSPDCEDSPGHGVFNAGNIPVTEGITLGVSEVFRAEDDFVDLSTCVGKLNLLRFIRFDNRVKEDQEGELGLFSLLHTGGR